MTLIKSISGIRGTIGGKAGEGLNPLDIVKFTSAYATLIRRTSTVKSNKIVVGRDARISGEMVKNVVCGTLMGMGFDVVNIGLASTPTTELAVTMAGACGGIMITASHNPKQWNALKLLNEHGEFLNAAEGNEVLRIAEAEEFDYADVDHLGSYRKDLTYNTKHIDSVLALDLVDVDAIKKADFRVAIDCVNSVGGIILPELLERLGVKHVEKLYCEPTGNFAHNPEPLEKNLGDIMNLMKGGKADVAFVVDPDVDRLAMICEDGTMYGEEYTLVTVADYVLKHTPGNTVSNLSSTRALRDVTRKYGMQYNAAAVGEVNVVTKMKETNAVIGGEGNGGVIYPESHYGRDALVGIALFLSHLAHEGKKVSELRASYPSYFIAKNRIDLTPETDVDAILAKVKELYKDEEIDVSDINISPYEIQYTYGNSYLNGEYAARQIVRDNVLHSTVSTIGFPIFTYKDNGNVATVKYTYHPAWTEDFIKRVIAGYDEAMSLINLDDTDFAKALKLHDWIVKNVSYGMSKTYSDFAVGALANRSSVCAGYAQCYQFLLSQVGVDSIYIAANTTKEPHAWNLVKIDGHYFHVDCTWDRGLGANPNVNHTYFMLNDEEFNADGAHTEDWKNPSKG